MSVYHLTSWRFILLLDFSASFYLSTLSGFFSLLLINFSALLYDLMVITYGYVHTIFSSVLITTTKAVFINFEQVNGLLRTTDSVITEQKVALFVRKHAQTLMVVFGLNRFIGHLVLAFILFHLPQNTYFLMAIFFEHHQPITVIVLGNLVALQLFIIIFFHVLCTAYSARIHRPVKTVAHWAAQVQLESSVRFSERRKNEKSEIVSLPFRARLKIAFFIGKFNTARRYGIHYGSCGLISFASFGRFAVIYLKLIIYWYKMIRL